MPFSPEIFQLPIPPILYLIPPSHPLQWIVRSFFLIYTITTAIPLILLLVPLSIALHSYNPNWTILSIHPHNLPPFVSVGRAVRRGWVVYILGTLVWAITGVGNAPESDVGAARGFTKLVCKVMGVIDTLDSYGFGKGMTPVKGMMKGQDERVKGPDGRREFVLDEEDVPPVRDSYRFGAVREGEAVGLVLFTLKYQHNQTSLNPAATLSHLDRRDGYAHHHSGKNSPCLLSQDTTTPTTSSASSSTDHLLGLPMSTPKISRRAILFLAGGGYVTGTPLAHPFIFSLLKALSISHSPNLGPNPKLTSSQPRSAPNKEDDHPTYTVYAPYVRKSLSADRSFPIPLIDALTAYSYLRKQRGYEPEEIVLVGDSAGGGLCWTLLAYLGVLEDIYQTETGLGRSGFRMGLPGKVVMISPWLALPPTIEPQWPDYVDSPQLFNAARCYMARYPILKYRPDPFSGDLSIWTEAIVEYSQKALSNTLVLLQRGLQRSIPFKRFIRHCNGLVSTSNGAEKEKDLAEKVLHPDDDFQPDLSLRRWVDKPIFEKMTSHHPLVSPGTDPSHPFSHKILEILKDNHVRVLLHAGTAELFYEPSMKFAKEMKRRGVDVNVQEERGGFHVEGCTFPAEWGGAAGRLVSALEGWIRDGE